MKAKIITTKGKHFTLEITSEDDVHLEGLDKYSQPVKLLKKNIQERIPYGQR